MQTVANSIGLPRINEVPISVTLTAVARKLEATYSDLVSDGVPEPLAVIVERLGRDPAGPPPTTALRFVPKIHPRDLQDRGLASNSLPAGRGRAGGNLPWLLISAVGLGFGLAWMLNASKSSS
jgi:hypothetical protein